MCVSPLLYEQTL